ncbi:MAG: GPR endopeptidase [Prevotella sp.]|nr:GPR endopeptidase [Prevotella sp.]
METITDLACELLRRAPRTTSGVAVSTTCQAGITVHQTTISTPTAAHSIGKPIGTYLNLDTTHGRPRNIVNALRQALISLLTDTGKILIVGLGNDKFVADSLGPCVLQQIDTGEQLLTFEPCVFGVTGINSVDAIQAITHLVHPTAVIVIDSLVSATPERIGTNYQICTSGITPGSGIGRDNQTIDRKLLGVPVLAIGVPVCTIMTPTKGQIYHVVPKDIDVVIRDCAQIIARSLNTLVSRN